MTVEQRKQMFGCELMIIQQNIIIVPRLTNELSYLEGAHNEVLKKLFNTSGIFTYKSTSSRH